MNDRGHAIENGAIEDRLGELMRRELAIKDTADVEPFMDEPDWLALPLARREALIGLAESFVAYEKMDKPGVAEIDAIARTHGFSRAKVYRLLAEWRQHHRVVPQAASSARRGSAALPAERQAALSGAIDKAVAENPGVPMRAMLPVVRSLIPADLLPADLTIRAAIRSRVETGQAEQPFAVVSGREAFEGVVAHAHGDAMVIDHVTPDFFVQRCGERVRCTATLGIDLATKRVEGFTLTCTTPGAQSVADTIRDAEARSAANGANGSARPVLLLRTTTGADWRALERQIRAAGIDARIGKDQRLRRGRAARLLIGAALGPVRLLARLSPSDGFDAERHGLVTIEQASGLIEHAVAAHNAGRRTEATALNAITFGLDDTGG